MRGLRGLPALQKLLGKKRMYIALLLIPAALLTLLAQKSPALTEKYYSLSVSRVLTEVFGRVTGAVAFSIAEWVLVAAVIGSVVYIAVYIKRLIQNKNRAANTVNFIANILCAAGIIGFGFTILCGLNYHRESFAIYSGLEVRPSSTAELKELCLDLKNRTNEVAVRVNRNDDNIMQSGYASYYDLARGAQKAYSKIGGEYAVLSGYYPRPKPVLMSVGMSMADLVGVYFPFTFEANVNVDVPDYEIPSSMLHELAHFRGFMREDEANFISYLTCVTSGDDDFAYSGLMLALVHTSNQLYSADKDAYWQVMDGLDDGVRADFKANSEYWKQFEGPVAAVSEKVNDVYLKTNKQAQGVKSYGRMVDLLLAEYRKKHEK